MIGTLGNGFVGALAPSPHTTPDAAALQATLAALRDEGAASVAMEVSSHGLDQGRVNGVAFDVALFTNLTRDHLDYHGNDGGVRRGEGAPVRVAGTARVGDQRRRCLRPAARRGREGARRAAC